MPFKSSSEIDSLLDKDMFCVRLDVERRDEEEEWVSRPFKSCWGRTDIIDIADATHIDAYSSPTCYPDTSSVIHHTLTSDFGAAVHELSTRYDVVHTRCKLIVSEPCDYVVECLLPSHSAERRSLSSPILIF